MSLEVKKIFDEEASAIIGEVRALIISSGAYATGKSSRSLEEEATNTRMTIYGGNAFGLNRAQRSFIEGGRGPGGAPPVNDILEWAIAKGVVDANAVALAVNNIPAKVWAIRSNIAKRGTSTVSESKPRNIFTSVINDARIERILGRVGDSYLPSISSEIIKTLTDGRSN